MGEQKAREAAIERAMKGEACGNCKCALDAGPMKVVCRADPPTVIPLTWVTEAATDKPGAAVTQITNVGSHFPEMAKDGWCGRWKTKLILN